MKKNYVKNKFFNDENIEQIIPTDETIIWKSKPHYDSYTINQLFTLLWIIPIIWTFFNYSFIMEEIANFKFFIRVNSFDWFGIFYLFYISIRLFPIWSVILYIFTYWGRWNKEEYLCTDKRIYIKYGMIYSHIRIFDLNKIDRIKQEYKKTYHIFKTSDIIIFFKNNKTLLFRDINEIPIKTFLEENVLKNCDEYKK